MVSSPAAAHLAREQSSHELLVRRSAGLKGKPRCSSRGTDEMACGGSGCGWQAVLGPDAAQKPGPVWRVWSISGKTLGPCGMATDCPAPSRSVLPKRLRSSALWSVNVMSVNVSAARLAQQTRTSFPFAGHRIPEVVIDAGHLDKRSCDDVDRK